MEAFCTALLCPDYDTNMIFPPALDPQRLCKGHWTYLLNTGFQCIINLSWGSLLFKFFFTVWRYTLTFSGNDIWVQFSSFLQLVQVGFWLYMCCPFAVPNDDSITGVTHVMTSLVLSFTAWQFYWSSCRLMALDETLHNFKSRFKNRLLPLWDIRYF